MQDFFRISVCFSYVNGYYSDKMSAIKLFILLMLSASILPLSNCHDLLVGQLLLTYLLHHSLHCDGKKLKISRRSLTLSLLVLLSHDRPFIAVLLNK